MSTAVQHPADPEKLQLAITDPNSPGALATGELTRIFVAPVARKTGVGASVVEYLEARAREAGLTTLRLDTRLDLVNARRLYERLGYTAVAPFTDGTYSEVWLSKEIE